MNARNLLLDCDYDKDTYRLLDIALLFLVRYFGHSDTEAEQLMVRFHQSFSQQFDEDAIHHESSYRLAAIIHYLVSMRGRRDGLGDWLSEEGHSSPPAEALEYFREHYFVK